MLVVRTLKKVIKFFNQLYKLSNGGGSGIRTHGRDEPVT